MKHWRRYTAWLLAIVLVCGTVPLTAYSGALAAQAISLDEYERENYLKPDSTPMEATPTVISPQNTSFKTLPSSVQMLDGTDWQMAEGGTQANRLSSAWSDSIAATVPASIHTNLMNAGKLEDPYVGLNDAAANAQSDKTWWMKKTFTYTGSGENVRLNFEGVCDRMTVWLNGTQVGSHQGMFGGPYLDITGVVQQGENTLIVRLDPALPYKQTVVFNCSYGWHYAKIRPLGIWNSVSVEDVTAVEIVDPFIAAKDTATGTMDLSVELNADAAFSGTLKLKVSPKNFSGSATTYAYAVQADGDTTVRLQFDIPNPQLWWPNGYGDQNLYWLELEFEDQSGNVIDYDKTSFGIRTVEMGPTPQGESEDRYNWTFIINGQEIFMKGTGWCTTDALMRFDEASYDTQLQRAREQGNQLLRAWGGGMPETDTFYDLCDEYGLCVYQEWPIGSESYTTQPQAVLYETVELNVRRLRNRPSLIMWGGGNEGSAELENTVLNTMGKLTLENDGTRPWHRQDPYGKGSSHNYNPYWGGQSLDRYLNIADTFLSEFGLPSLPNVESILKYAPASELSVWPIAEGSSIWHHTPNFGVSKPSSGYADGDIAMMSYFADEFILLDSVQSLVLGTQVAQAVGYRHTIENARTLWPNSTGIAYYKLNDVYPGASWSTVDWYGSPKISHYFVQDAYQPLAAVSIVKALNSYGKALSVPIWLLDDNDELSGSSWTVSARAYNGDLTLIKEERYTGSGSIDRTRQLGSLTLTAAQTATAPLFIVTDIIKNGELAARNYIFINYEQEIGSLFTLPVASLSYTQTGNVYTVTNTGDRPAVAVNLVASDSTSLLLSDNYFWLEPGESKQVTVDDVEEGADGTRVITGVTSWNEYDTDDRIAPSAPTQVTAQALSNDSIRVSWTAAADAQSGVLEYRVYRNGVKVGTVNGMTTSFTDVALTEATSYTYTVEAVDRGLNLSATSNRAVCTTAADAIVPQIVGSSMTGASTVKLQFSEPMDATSAQTAANYVLSSGQVTAAALSADGLTVTLTTSGTVSGKEYILTVKGVKDRAKNGNEVKDVLIVGHGLQSYWSFDEAAGSTVHDLTKNSGDATLYGSSSFITGISGYGAALNTVGSAGSYGKIPSFATDFGDSFTLALRVRPMASGTGAYQVVFSKGNKGAGHLEVDITKTGLLEIYIPDLTVTGAGATSTVGVISTGKNIMDGAWHDIAVVKSGTAMTVYVDGTAVRTTTVSGTIAASTGDLFFGSFSASQFPYKGDLDEVRLYNRALSASEVTALGAHSVPTVDILTEQKVTLAYGEEHTLAVQTVPAYATVKPSLSWTSDNASVVSVTANGTVRGLGKGSATVTVTSGALSASCAVTVSGSETTPPTADAAQFATSSTVTVEFSEVLDKGSAETIANYVLSGNGKVNAATLSADGKKVTLQVQVDANADYRLTVSGVKDLAGNVMIRNTFYLAPGLLGYWQFNEGSGTAVKDSTGNTADMTVSGPTYVTAPDGLDTAMSFNKNKVMGTTSVNLGNSFTVAAFIKAATNTPGWGVIMGKGDKTAGHFEIYFDTYNTRNLEFYAPDLSPNTFDSGIKLADAAWHHIGITLQNGTLIFYVDGAAVKTFTGVSGSIASTTDVLSFGGLSAYSGTYIGELDEVRIYDHALSADMMQGLAHIYDGLCDSTCSVCGAVRTVTHDYDGACDAICNGCGTTRVTNEKHVYEGDFCSVCGVVRTYDNVVNADIVDGKVMVELDRNVMLGDMRITGESSVNLGLGAAASFAGSYLRYEFLLEGVKNDSSVRITLQAGSTQWDVSAAVLAAAGLTSFEDGCYVGAISLATLFGNQNLSGLTLSALRFSLSGGVTLRANSFAVVSYREVATLSAANPELHILGAGVRGESDIRFGVQLSDRDWYAGTQITNVSYGTLVVPTTLLQGQLTLASEQVLVIPTLKWQTGLPDQNGNPYAGSVYTSVVTSVPSVDEQLSARGYMTFSIGGVEYVTYTAMITRTIRQVYATVEG